MSSSPPSSTNRCYALFCDVGCIVLAVSAVSLFFLSMEPGFHMEKSSATSGSGFHLLSCPKLFVDKEEEEYTDIRLNKDSTAKLMTMLEDAVQHAHVLHTGEGNKGRLGMNRRIFEAVKEQVGTGKEVDVNVPRRVDNAHLCTILKNIVDEQDKNTLSATDNDEDDGTLVTISIMKLDTSGKESILLRGARMVRNSPIVDNVVMRWSRLDGNIRKVFAEKKTNQQEPDLSNKSDQTEPVVHLEGTLAEDAVQVE